MHCFSAECMQEITILNIQYMQSANCDKKRNSLLNYNKQIVNQAPNSQHRSNILKYRQMSCLFCCEYFERLFTVMNPMNVSLTIHHLLLQCDDSQSAIER